MKLHEGLSRITAVSVNQYISGLAGRMAFSGELERDFSAGRTRAAQDMLARTLAGNPDFLYAAVFDSKGRELVSAGQSALPPSGEASPVRDPFFERSLKRREVVIGRFGAYAGGPGGAVFFPLDYGKVLYVEVSFEQLWIQIHSLRFGKTGSILLSDAEGKIFRIKNDTPPPVSPAFLKKKYAGRDSGVIARIPTEYGVFVGAFDRVPGTNMAVLTLQLRQEAFWAIHLTVWITIFFFLAITTIAYFAALFLAGKISGPVESLRQGAVRVAAHDFSTPIPCVSWLAELETLALSFNNMMSELGKYHAMQLDKMLDEKRKLDLLISLMRDGIILTDMRGVPLFMNSRARELTSSGFFDYLFKNNALPSGERTRKIMQELVALVSRNEPVCIKSAGGAPGYFRIITEVFKGRTREETGILIILRDVTMEREIDNMKEEFFNAVAHDLRAPLMGLQGYVRLLENPAGEAEKKAYLASMDSSVRQLFKLVESVLEISRMETGTLKLNKAEFDFKVLAETVIDGLRPVMEESRLKVALSVSDDERKAFGDERLLGRVLNNLLSNAVKFSGPGSAIEVASYIKPGGSRVVKVKDSGAGIEPGQRELIFEKYRQTESGVKAGGYGLGLAIAKKIVSMHGGHIWAESAGPGKGAVFTFTLPPEKPSYQNSSRNRNRRRYFNRRRHSAVPPAERQGQE
ncbi:MAG: ATP-binding protein [Elusimicrobiaceae bacterium]